MSEETKNTQPNADASRIPPPLPCWDEDVFDAATIKAFLDISHRLKRSQEARKSLSDAVDVLQKRERHLQEALKLAARWGIRSDGYSAEVSANIREWVDCGFRGESPKQPDYYPNVKRKDANE